MAIATPIATTERLAPRANPDPTRTHGCAEYAHVRRASGLGRHLAYFALTDERTDGPLDERRTPSVRA